MNQTTDILPPALGGKEGRIRDTQKIFGGLSGSPDAAAHEIQKMKNLSPEAYPAIATREERKRYLPSVGGTPHGIFSHDPLVIIDGDGLYTSSEAGVWHRVAALTDTDQGRCFGAFGPLLFIQPDQMYYDRQTNLCHPFALDTGELEDAALGINYITEVTTDWESMGFVVGDGIEVQIKDYVLGEVLIDYCKIKNIVDSTLFLDKSFEHTGTYAIRVRRRIPDMDHICAVGDRLWGCGGNKIYACEAGNPFNWYAVSGEESDPVALETGASGSFTACASWQGYAVFFKENHIYKLVSNGFGGYGLSDLAAPGVSADAQSSLCEVGGDLYYLSSGGVYRYDGDYPTYVGKALNQSLTHGVGGSDGINYYLSAKGEDGAWCFYVYVPEREAWYLQDHLQVVSMTRKGNILYLQLSTGEIMRTVRSGEADDGQPTETEMNLALPSLVEFGEDFGGTPDGLRLHALYLRVRGEEEGALRVSLAYDGQDAWQEIACIEGTVKGIRKIPVFPRRCSSYRLRLDMTGKWLISEIIREYERGGQ